MSLSYRASEIQAYLFTKRLIDVEDLIFHNQHIKISFLKDFITLILERGEGREKERERNIDV